MMLHESIDEKALRSKIRKGVIILGGNKRLRIYGKLNCKSGKRMKRTHRVFFYSEQEALEAGYRPCGNCLRSKYLAWKQSRLR